MRSSPIYHVAFSPVCPKLYGTLKVTWTVPKTFCAAVSVRPSATWKKNNCPPSSHMLRGSRGARFESVVVARWRSTSMMPEGNAKEYTWKCTVRICCDYLIATATVTTLELTLQILFLIPGVPTPAYMCPWPPAGPLRDHVMCHSRHPKEWLKGVVATTQSRYCPLHLFRFALFHDHLL